VRPFALSLVNDDEAVPSGGGEPLLLLFEGADWSYTPTETSVATLEAAFTEFTERSDIAILLINQHVRRLPLFRPSYASMLTVHSLQVADQIRPVVEKYEQAFPALLEIPSKDHPYGTSLFLPLFLTPTHLYSTQTRRRTPS
jgi:vacuolar-type H+-ATPase subunit F/Vma7